MSLSVKRRSKEKNKLCTSGKTLISNYILPFIMILSIKENTRLDEITTA